MTPEGRVKIEIDKVLKQYAGELWYHKPVQNGMGSPCLDYHGCHFGRYFAIEAKAPGEKPTLRQEITIRNLRAAKATVFVISDAETLQELRVWLMEIHR